jgi:hypothetical protein
MADRTDRRTDHARRRRVDQLIARVRRARDEIVDKGLEAVHGPEPGDAEPRDAEPRQDGVARADPPRASDDGAKPRPVSPADS